MTAHTLIISLGSDLGYYEGYLGGVCHGITLRWIEASLLNEEHIFHTRVKKIINNNKTLPWEIRAARQKVKNSEELNQQDLDTLDIPAFYQSIALYLLPNRYFDFFHASSGYAQQNIEEIARFAASDKIQDQGGLSVIYSEPGIYNLDEIRIYLDELGKTIEQAGCLPEEKTGIVLSNMNHTIGLIYQPQTEWTLMDINPYTESSPVFKGNSQDTAKKITESFSQPNHSSPYFAFSTSVVITKNHAQHAPLTEHLNTFKSTHVITPEMAQREDITGKDATNLAWIAARDGSISIINALKEYGADLDKANDEGITPAFNAAQNGHSAIINILSTAGANLKKSKNGGVSPAYIAAANGHALALHALKEGGVDLDQARSDGTTPAHGAAWFGHAPAIAALKELESNLDKVNQYGETPAQYAAERDKASALLALITAGINPNQINKKGDTLAHIAAENGCPSVIGVLRDAGADLNNINNTGKTPALLAVEKGYDSVFRILKDAGVNLNLRDNKGNTLAHIAAQKGFSSIIEVLKDADLDLNQTNNEGDTPMKLAIQNGHFSAINVLADAGVNLNQVNNEGHTLAQHAAMKGYASGIAALKAAGVNLDQVDNNGNTLAHIAAENDQESVLLELDLASLDKVNNNGETPAQRAVEKQCFNAIFALNTAGIYFNQTDHNGENFAHSAAKKGHQNSIYALNLIGIDIGKANNHGATPAYFAAQNGHDSVIKNLLRYKKNMDIPYITSAASLRDFAAKHDDSVNERMNLIIQRQMDAGENEAAISIKPYDIAWIMGHKTICEQLSSATSSAIGLFAEKNQTTKNQTSDLESEQENPGNSPSNG